MDQKFKLPIAAAILKVLKRCNLRHFLQFYRKRLSLKFSQANDFSGQVGVVRVKSAEAGKKNPKRALGKTPKKPDLEKKSILV